MVMVVSVKGRLGGECGGMQVLIGSQGGLGMF